MRKSKFTEAQIVAILSEGEEPSANLQDLCRKHAISDKTFYRWKRVYGGLNDTQATRLKQLEHENLRLRKLVVERDLELDVMKEIAAKKW